MALKENDAAIAWYAGTLAKLEVFQGQLHLLDGDEETPPSDLVFKNAREFLEILGKQPPQGLAVPRIWHTPNGELGFTWTAPDWTFDVTIGEYTFRGYLKTTNGGIHVSNPAPIAELLSKQAA